MILTDGEIEARMQARINDTWPPSKREKALRLGGALLGELNAFFAQMSIEKAAMIAERDAALAAIQSQHDSITPEVI